MRRLTLICFCIFQLASAAEPGPAIGSRFPIQSLHIALGPKGAAILVYQASAPSAQTQLSELEQHRDAFRAIGIGVASVSDERAGFHSQPGWFILDAKGVIAAKYVAESGEIYTSAAILVRRFGWNPSGAPTELQGRQLSASLNASNSSVAPGERVALTVDIDLQPDMHVYAPGVAGYLPIDWKIDDSPAARTYPPQFPRAQKLFLKAIGETVPAYRGHIRLTRDLAIQPSTAQSGQFTVDGSLRYQACDDRVCYIPQTLKLQWRFQYETLNNQTYNRGVAMSNRRDERLRLCAPVPLQTKSVL